MKKIRDYLKTHPKNGCLCLITKFYSFLMGGGIIVRHNTINYGNSVVKKIKVKIEGRNNYIDFGYGFNKIDCCRIFIRGNNNKIIIGERSNVREVEFWMEDDRGSIILGTGFNSWGRVHLAETESKSIQFGDGCMLAGGVTIRTGDSHSIIDIESSERINSAKSVTIGNRVWLAHNSTVLKGVIIGDDSVVGSGAIVSQSMPSNSVIAGVPARVVKSNIIWLSKRI